jgi:hypothetical protein
MVCALASVIYTRNKGYAKILYHQVCTAQVLSQEKPEGWSELPESFKGDAHHH